MKQNVVTPSCLFFAVAVALMSQPASAAKTCTWTGGGATANWDNAANWDEKGIPAAGDNVVLSNSGTTPEIENDIAGLSIATLTFSGSNPLTLKGLPLTFSATWGTFSSEITAGVCTNAVALTFTQNGTIAYNGNVEFVCGVTNLASSKSMTVRYNVQNGPERHAYFRAPFYAPSCTLSLVGHRRNGYTHFCDEINVSAVTGDGGNTSGASGIVSFESENTTFGTATMKFNSFLCGATNSLDRNGKILWQGWAENNTTFVDLNGFDQTINRTYSGDWNYATYRQFKSSSPARLTLASTESGVANCMFNGKVSVCFNPASSETSFKVTNSVSTTTGDIIVSNGTFEVAGTATFAKVGTIEVSDGAAFIVSSTAETPLGNQTATIRLAEGASLELPENSSISVAALYVGGIRMDGGRLTHATLPQLADNGATIYVLDYEREPVACTWSGEDATDSVFADANWDGGTAPNLLDGTAAATFATGGTAAEVASAISIYSLAFSGASGMFDVTGGGSISLYGSSITVADAHTNVVSVPLVLRDSQTISVGAGSRLELSGKVSEASGFTYGFTKTGSGELAIRGVNALSGNVTISGGLLSVYSPSNGLVKAGAAGSVSGVESTGAKLALHGAIVDGDVSWSPNDVAGAFSADSGTNIIKGAFTLGGNKNFKPSVSGNATLIFDGGFTQSASYIYLENGTSSSGGTYVFRNRPYLKPSGIAPLVLGSYQTVQFAAPSNTLVCINVKGTNPAVDLLAPYALSDNRTELNFSGNHNTDARIRLNGFNQDVGIMRMTKGANNMNRPVIESSAPAVLSFSQSVLSTNTLVAFKGQIDLVKKGSATFAFARDYAATGTVSVLEGKLAFTSAASAPNVTNLTVSGGTLSIGAPKTFPKTVTVELSCDAGSVIDLDDGVRQKCKELVFDGVQMPHGTYGSSTSGARYSSGEIASHFSGGGVLEVVPCGCMIIVH